MLFPHKSSLLAAALMVGPTLVRAQFQGGGIFRILNWDNQTTYVLPSGGPQDGTPVVASYNPPQGIESRYNLWNITQAQVDDHEKYIIRNLEYGQGVDGNEGGQLVTTSHFSDSWIFKPVSDSSYLIQKADSNLTWTSSSQDSEERNQTIYLNGEDGSPAQQFTFVESGNWD